jgi:hypothetical protein
LFSLKQMRYQLIRTYGEPQTGRLMVPATEKLQTARTLLGVAHVSEVRTLADEDAYEVYDLANAKDYAQQHPAGRLAEAQVSNGALDRELVGPVLIVYRSE